MMTTSYDAIVQEKENDITTMNVSKYQLQVAKSVSNPGGAPSFNVIYASKLLGPNMSVSWTANYALSWSTDIAAPGAQVSYSGNWTPCAVGESFDLDVDGYFKPNPNNPNGDASSLNVGSNNYPVPVNIVVGVEDSTKPGTYTAIWVDPTKLIEKAHGEFTPRESVQLYYSSGDQTATMISSKGTPVHVKDVTENRQWWFYYESAEGVWHDQGAPYPPGSEV